jgi:hypothetical protein
MWIGCHVFAGLDELGVGKETGGSGAQGGQGTAGAGGEGAKGGAGGAMASGTGGMGVAGAMDAVSVGPGGGGVTVNCCGPHPDVGCTSNDACEGCVCACQGQCCTQSWDQTCAMIAQGNCFTECMCVQGPVQPCVAAQ